MNNDKLERLLKDIADAKITVIEESELNPLSQYSTNQIKEEIRSRKRKGRKNRRFNNA